MTDDLKYLLPSARTAVARILAYFALLSLVGCTVTSSLSQAGEAHSANVSAIKDLSFFDSIVTLEAVFPDPAVRAHYRIDSPRTEGESRIYEFRIQLNKYYSENTDHHVSVILTPMVASERVFSATIGRYNERCFKEICESLGFMTSMPDGKYDIAVTSSMRLPDEVGIPAFDPESTAKRLQQSYLRNLGDLNLFRPQAEVSPESSAKAVEAKDFSFLDSIVTPETVFLDPARRALFEIEMSPPDTKENGGRAYEFIFRQPGVMDHYVDGEEFLHEDLQILVVWMPAGKVCDCTLGIGWTRGVLDEVGVRTLDGVYDLYISWIMPHPNGANEHGFDLRSMAERLLQRYSQQ